jgi:hypothetical protein
MESTKPDPSDPVDPSTHASTHPSNDPSTDPLIGGAVPSAVGSVWQVYKSRFVPTQAFIAISCAVMYFAVKMNGATVISSWVLLQFAAVYGAWSGKKLADGMSKRGAGGMQKAE